MEIEVQLNLREHQRLIRDASLGGTTGDAASVFILDPNYVRHGILKGERVEPLAKTGLADKRSMAVDWCVKLLNRDSCAQVADIDYTIDVAA